MLVQQQHVNFIGTDGSVHELYYDGSWKHNNLTQLTGAPGPRVGIGLDGYATNYNGQQHVNFGRRSSSCSYPSRFGCARG